VELTLNPASLDDYRKFLAIKKLPHYRFTGRTASFPDEYAERVIDDYECSVDCVDYEPHEAAFDYQRDIARIALQKRKFCIFADCGLGKTLMFLDWVRHVTMLVRPRRVLIISPLMVIPQTLAECERFHGTDDAIRHLASNELQAWLDGKLDGHIAIVNYDALTDDIHRTDLLGGLVLDESSMLKSHYGKWGRKCLELGRGLDWKLACTGTPAPNDRIEYANHAVFMDAFPTVNSFLARFFVNRGQTSERWAMKDHAIKPFYRALSHWAIFLTNPSTYGWADNAEPLPPIVVHKHRVEMTAEQTQLAYDATGRLIQDHVGGITSRSVLSQIGKGSFRGRDVETAKPAFVRSLVESWPDESTIIWCIYNREQERLEKELPDAGSMTGATPIAKRLKIIDAFKAGKLRTIISKPKILGFGLNLQIATRHIFSGLQDSYESYYQAVKRSNRYGAVHPLNVHIPFTDVEFPMIENVLVKADRVQRDTEEQERIFKNATLG
jgi:superfamily II DNA or RNA helicase